MPTVGFSHLPVWLLLNSQDSGNNLRERIITPNHARVVLASLGNIIEFDVVVFPIEIVLNTPIGVYSNVQ